MKALKYWQMNDCMQFKLLPVQIAYSPVSYRFNTVSAIILHHRVTSRHIQNLQQLVNDADSFLCHILHNVLQ